MVPSGEASGIERMTSQSLDEELADIDISTKVVRMAWDDRTQGAHLFITDLSGGTTPDIHYYWDSRHNAWYKDEFANYQLDPTCVAVFDGDDPDDRHILLGCRDGYVRKIDVDAKSDDTYPIDSYCWLGPMYLRDRELLRLKEVQPVLGNASSDVSIRAYGGNSAENAIGNSPSFIRTVKAGRDNVIRERAMGHHIYLRLGNCADDQTWTLEHLLVRADSFSGLYQRVF